jgi:GNAT superfamily N-acetyltransferase
MSVAAQEPVVQVSVRVTFLRMEHPPAGPLPPLPPGAEVRRDRWCSVAQYRRLYDTVGEQYVWWLRRVTPDHQLAAMLRDPRVAIHVLTVNGEEAGFYELDRTPWPAVNLSYFGLMPHAIGRGLGFPFLCHAVTTVWEMRPRAMTVNTCTADHPRALPNYLRAGFRPVREVDEVWNVPLRLGMPIPERLRI